MILLDTHVVLWIVGDSPPLGSAARAAITNNGARRVLAMVAWEIAMSQTGRILPAVSRLRNGWPIVFRHIDAGEVAVNGATAVDAGGLRDGIHGDPCDRIMIATARALGCPLVRADEKILDYASRGHLAAIDARG